MRWRKHTLRKNKDKQNSDVIEIYTPITHSASTYPAWGAAIALWEGDKVWSLFPKELLTEDALPEGTPYNKKGNSFNKSQGKVIQNRASNKESSSLSTLCLVLHNSQLLMRSMLSPHGHTNNIPLQGYLLQAVRTCLLRTAAKFRYKKCTETLWPFKWSREEPGWRS